MIGIVDACEKYFYDELKSLKSEKFYFKQKDLAQLLETPFEKIDRDQRSTLIAYAFHLHCRLLPLGVRHRVIECSGVKCSDELKLGYEQLKEELEKGCDLLPRLSTRIKQIDYSDGMFADWGITHFHLGKRSKNRIGRTGLIAYAYLVRDEAYIIMIGEHGRWSDQAIFDKLLNEYPRRIVLSLEKSISTLLQYREIVFICRLVEVLLKTALWRMRQIDAIVYIRGLGFMPT